MDRKAFIWNSCAACLSLGVTGILLSSCSATRYAKGRLVKDGMLVDSAEFRIEKGGTVTYRSFIIIRNDALQFPVCIYRVQEDEYKAVWMKCTHQGAELQVSGDRLQCPAHGSEFDKEGKLLSGPANKDLRTFPVTVQSNELFIDLRKP